MSQTHLDADHEVSVHSQDCDDHIDWQDTIPGRGYDDEEETILPPYVGSIYSQQDYESIVRRRQQTAAAMSSIRPNFRHKRLCDISAMQAHNVSDVQMDDGV